MGLANPEGFCGKNPDSTAFLEFTRTLREHISPAQTKSQLSITDQLQFELKE